MTNWPTFEDIFGQGIYLATSPALSQQNQDIKDNLVSPKIKTFPSSDVVWKAVLGKLTVAPTNLLWRRLKSFPQGFAQEHRSQAKEWATKTKTFPFCNCCFLFFTATDLANQQLKLSGKNVFQRHWNQMYVFFPGKEVSLLPAVFTARVPFLGSRCAWWHPGGSSDPFLLTLSHQPSNS